MFAGFGWVRRESNAEELRREAFTLVGKPETEVTALLGAPQRSYTVREYAAARRGEIAGSFAPDPPAVECDEVLVYEKGLRIVLLFIQSGRVVRVYSGLT